jgi:hypothetical protein
MILRSCHIEPWRLMLRYFEQRAKEGIGEEEQEEMDEEGKGASLSPVEYAVLVLQTDRV